MIAVLMMAHGTPDKLEQMQEYLSLVRGGRRPSPELVAEMTRIYAAIGGRSPLTDITRSQARALEDELGASFRVFVGMRNWHPFIREAVAEALSTGAERMIGLAMAPQYSALSAQKYLDAAREAAPAGFPLSLVRQWYDHPGLLDAFAEKAGEKMAGSSPFDAVVFTAHSLPERLRHEGHPSYSFQIDKTAEAVASRVGLSRWTVAYQSAGRTPEPWMGPDIREVLAELAGGGSRRVLVVPVGFVCDHTEILFDIDIQAAAAAREKGLTLVRSASLNTSPIFIRALADIVLSHLEH